MKHVLAIESSCDDTSVAVLSWNSQDRWPRVIGLSVQSQNEVHERFGGVVPELASRAHLQNLLPCIRKALVEAQLELSDMDYFAGTERPGLIGCLLVGHTAAKTLSLIYEKPFISVHHIEGHLMSLFIEDEPTLPRLVLVASGGHSSLYLIKSPSEFESLGVTLDDAVGEAFDKGAKLLGLGFPGGPALDRLAQKGSVKAYKFGRVSVPGFNFSFSGIKSDFSRTVAKEGVTMANRSDLAASYQEALVGHLIDKLVAATKETGVRHVSIVGGVAANTRLRERLNQLHSIGEIDSFSAPSLKYCTDNAAMIGFRAYRLLCDGFYSSLDCDVGSTSRPKVRHG